MLIDLTIRNDNFSGKYLHYGKKIDINNPDVIRSWCKIFGCAKEELREAINEVGDSVKALTAYFN